MNAWSDIALKSYYYASLPVRWRAARQRAARGTEPVCILFYHRVADEHPNDWTISIRLFVQQINWLRRRFDIVSIEEAQRRIASGENRRPTACITFDDGYGDNLQFAVPLLLHHQLPFTYFVATDYVFGGRPFPHDDAAGRPLPPNTLDELRQMAAAGIEIGGHTRSHCDLGKKLPFDQLTDEIAGCKHELEQALDCDVRYFAFPYGMPANMSTEAFHIAEEAGYHGVCSAYGSYNLPGDDPFHLRRFHADPEMTRFKNWLTLDPRKLRVQHNFVPGDYRMPACAHR